MSEYTYFQSLVTALVEMLESGSKEHRTYAKAQLQLMGEKLDEYAERERKPLDAKG